MGTTSLLVRSSEPGSPRQSVCDSPEWPHGWIGINQALPLYPPHNDRCRRGVELIVPLHSAVAEWFGECVGRRDEHEDAGPASPQIWS